MDIIAIGSQLASFCAVLLFGVVIGQIHFAYKLRKKLKELGVDEETLKKLLGK